MGRSDTSKVRRDGEPGCGAGAAANAVAKGPPLWGGGSEQKWRGQEGDPRMPELGEMLRGNAKPRGGGLPGKARRSFGGPGRVNRDAERTNGEDCHTMVTMTATACPSLGRGPFSRGGR